MKIRSATLLICLCVLSFFGSKIAYATEPNYLLKGRDIAETSTVAFSNDGSYLATATADGSILVWTTSNWKLAASLKVSDGYVGSIAFSQDDSSLAAATSSGATIIWELESKKTIATIRQEESQGVVKWLSNDAIVTASDEYDLKADVKIWELGKVRNKLDLELKTIARDIQILSKKQEIAVTNISRTVDIFDSATGKRKQRLGRFSDEPWQIRVSHDEKQMIILTALTIELWDLTTNRKLKVLNSETFDDQSDGSKYFKSMDWLSKHQLFAFGRGNGKLELRDEKHRRTVDFNLPGSLVTHMAFSRDGKYLAVCGWENRNDTGETFLAVIDLKKTLGKEIRKAD